MKRHKIFLICVLPLLILSGCWDQQELEERAYVVVLGLDKSEDNLINVTFQIANPQVGNTQQAEAPNEPPSDIVTITAPDILAAKELTNSIVSRRTNFDHLRTIIIGEELAKDSLIAHVLGSAIIDPQVRRDVNVIVSKEKASEFIHTNKSEMETRPHKYYNFMERRWKDTGYSPEADLNRYFLRLHGELYLATYSTTKKNEETHFQEQGYKAGEVPQKSGDPAQMIGSAVFKNGKMIGSLTGRETRIALFLRPKTITQIQTDFFPDPLNKDYHIAIKIIKDGHPRIRVNTKKERPEVKVSVPVKLQVFSDPSLTNYTTNIKNQKILKKAIKEDMEKNTMKLVKKTQEEFKGEPFLWHLEVRKHFWTLQDYENYNWQEKYQHAKVDIDYNIDIESFGDMIKPAKIGEGSF